MYFLFSSSCLDETPFLLEEAEEAFWGTFYSSEWVLHSPYTAFLNYIKRH